MRVCGEVIDIEENELSMSNRGISKAAFCPYTPVAKLFLGEMATRCLVW